MAFPFIVLAEIALEVAGKALNRKATASEMEKAITANPVLKNELNAEAPYQSRVVVGTSGAIIPAIGYLIWAVSSNGMNLAGYDPASTFLAAMTVGGAGFALIGRLVPGLKPLFSKS